MRVPIDWLHEYCRPDLDTAALADRLAMTGTEVERIEHHGVGALENFVVGRVLRAERHPDVEGVLRERHLDESHTALGEVHQVDDGADLNCLVDE